MTDEPKVSQDLKNWLENKHPAPGTKEYDDFAKADVIEEFLESEVVTRLRLDVQETVKCVGAQYIKELTGRLYEY